MAAKKKMNTDVHAKSANDSIKKTEVIDKAISASTDKNSTDEGGKVSTTRAGLA